MDFTAEQRGVVDIEGGERGDQLPVNILLVSFQDIVAVGVKRSRVREDMKVQEADRNAWCCRVPESEDQHMRKGPKESLLMGQRCTSIQTTFYPEAQLMKER
jgi:hypothetical protein